MTTTSRAARIPPVGLEGTLDVPHGARAVVLFAHGSGSGRLSPRNTRVAAALREGRLATLLFDLLTPDQAGDRTKIFDIPLLAERLGGATDWVRRQPEVAGLPIGSSAPARARRRRSSRRRRWRRRSAPSCRAAGAPTSPARRWARSAPRRS